ncbi:lysophosphatidic acid receptor 5 [Ambystoma mexicanum]|uniref:lysophosphatidic acid receptor 5 n=1 Tax=Ambystoma mexicanum TaxID=8296 RepID=UPI0037E9C0BD
MANTSDNLSFCEDYRFNHGLHLVGYSVIFSFGLLFNVLALWIFLRYLRLKSVVSIYMFNLALSDLLFTLSLPLRLFYYSQHHWPFGTVLCQLSGSLFQINMYGSCLFLMCINLDRYVAIVHPLRWRHLRRPKVARLVCIAVWILILVSCIPAARIHVSNDCRYQNGSISRCFEGFSTWEKEVLPLMVLAEIVGFLLPLGAVVYGSCRIFRELCRSGGTQSVRRQKTIRLLIVNLAIFVVCFVPYNTTLAAYGLLKANVVKSTATTRSSVRQVLVVTVLLASLNCTLDPLVYYFSTEGFRNTFKRLRMGQGWDSEGGTDRTLVRRSGTTRSNSSNGDARYSTIEKDSPAIEKIPPTFGKDSPTNGRGHHTQQVLRPTTRLKGIPIQDSAI